MPSQQHVKEIFTACDRLDGVVGLLYDLARAAEVLTLTDAFSTVRAFGGICRSRLVEPPQHHHCNGGEA